MSDAARLGAALFTLTERTWPALSHDARGATLAALDAFVAGPSPARFVAAARALADARRRTRGERIDALLGERTFARGVARLADVGFVDDETRAALVAQPHVAAAGRRLGALAAMLDAHAELAARLRGADAAHVTIDATPPPPPERERRTRTPR
jgi:hypothetical protein